MHQALVGQLDILFEFVNYQLDRYSEEYWEGIPQTIIDLFEDSWEEQIFQLDIAESNAKTDSKAEKAEKGKEGEKEVEVTTPEIQFW